MPGGWRRVVTTVRLIRLSDVAASSALSNFLLIWPYYWNIPVAPSFVELKHTAYTPDRTHLALMLMEQWTDPPKSKQDGSLIKY
jgi:hypothetical protein